MAAPTQKDFRDLIDALKKATRSFNGGSGGSAPSGGGGSPTGGATGGAPNRTVLQNQLNQFNSSGFGRARQSRKNFSQTRAASKAGGMAGKLGKLNMVSMIADAVGKVAKAVANVYNDIADYKLKVEVINKKLTMESMNYSKDLALKNIELYKQIADTYQEIKLNTLTESFANNMSVFNDGINAAAYSQLRTQRQNAAALKKAQIQESIARNEYDQAVKERTADYTANVKNLGAEQEQASAELTSSLIGTAGSMLSVIPGVGDLADAASQTISGTARRNVERTAIEQELMKTEAQLTQVNVQAANTRLEIESRNIDAADKMLQTTEKLAQSIESLTLEIDKSANAMGVQYGYSGEQLQQFKRGMMESSKTLAVYNKTMADAQKWQASYIENSGRAVNLSDKDMASMASLDMLFGEDGLSARLTAGMNIFNTSIQSGNDMIFSMYQKANKMGISNKKFAADLEKSLKQAQKYQFKGGVEGVAKMALWAQKVRFNMDELDSILSKMHTGNIEDVIQTSARLNVLGGNAGLLSDPMGMLYNAYADPAQYAKNLNDMIAGYGHFNKKTGETEFNINEQMRLEAISAATGQSKESLMNQVRQKNKSSELDKILGNKYNKEDRSLIDSKATYNKEKGIWEVGVWDKAKGMYVNQDASNLSPDQLASIRAEGTDKELPQYVKDIRDWTTQLDATVLQEKTDLATSAYVNTITQFSNRIDAQNKDYETHRQEYLQGILENEKAFTEAFAQGKILAQQAQTDLKEHADAVARQGQEMAIALEGITNTLNAINTELNGYTQNGPSGMSEDYAESMVKNMNDKKLASKFAKQWGDVIDAAQDTDITNGKGQYNNEDFMKNGYAWFDEYGNMFLNLKKTDGFEGDEDVYTMMANIQKSGYQVNPQTGKVTRVGDMILTNEGVMYQTSPNDKVRIEASQSGGFVDEMKQGNTIPQNVSVNFGGTIMLKTDKFSIDLLDVLRNDPNALRELAKEIIVEGSRTTFGGKHQWAPNRYTFGN